MQLNLIPVHYVKSFRVVGEIYQHVPTFLIFCGDVPNISNYAPNPASRMTIWEYLLVVATVKF